VFATVGADGSVRMFDLRNLDHSTIIYESANLAPLLRLEWNKLNPNFIATFAADSSTINIVDIRRLPAQSMIELKGHNGYVNSIAWAPHSPNHICSSADDCQAYIWDISRHVVEGNDPILAYTAAGEINNMKWCSSQPDWVSIVYKDVLQICTCIAFLHLSLIVNCKNNHLRLIATYFYKVRV
jgi:WD repeat-containing protein 68